MTEENPLLSAQKKFAASIAFRSLQSESVNLTQALGRISASDVPATLDSPPYARAIVEGFLINTSDSLNASDDSSVSFKVTGQVNPGDKTAIIPNEGEAIQVATGSIVPPGEFSIVRMWDAKIGENEFSINRRFPPGFFIEEQGCDIKKGSIILPAGKKLTPQNIGTLASMGIDVVNVIKKPRVSIFASGDEVIPHNEEFMPGKIYDCNSPMLAAAVEECGGIAKLCGIQTDNFDAFLSTLKKSLADSDMIIISGGTAVGGRDFISDLIRSSGNLIIDGVPMRSGRPLIMGVAQQVPIVCVAGHPPEALRGFNLFGVLAMNLLTGHSNELPSDTNQ